MNQLVSQSSEKVLLQQINKMYNEICSVNIIITDKDSSIMSDANDKNQERKKNVFMEQFCQYFCDKIHKGDIKAGIESYLTIFLLESAIFWQIVDKIVQRSVSQQQDSGNQELSMLHIIGLTQKYCDLGLMDVCAVDDFGQTLYHIAAAYNAGEILETLVKVDNDLIKYQTRLRKVCFLSL